MSQCMYTRSKKATQHTLSSTCQRREQQQKTPPKMQFNRILVMLGRKLWSRGLVAFSIWKGHCAHEKRERESEWWSFDGLILSGKSLFFTFTKWPCHPLVAHKLCHWMRCRPPFYSRNLKLESALPAQSYIKRVLLVVVIILIKNIFHRVRRSAAEKNSLIRVELIYSGAARKIWYL